MVILFLDLGSHKTKQNISQYCLVYQYCPVELASDGDIYNVNHVYDVLDEGNVDGEQAGALKEHLAILY
jgi:hypothetical protein